MKSQPEFRLACVIADWLARVLPERAVWSHFPAGENRSAITGARLKRMGTRRGMPDYLIFIDGKFIGMELKAGAPVTAEQRAVGDAIVANGGAWSIVRSLEESDAFLRASGVPLRFAVTARAA